MTAYTGLKELVKKTILTTIDDHQEGLHGVALDQRVVGRLQKQITSADRLNAAVATCETEMIRWIKASSEDRSNFDFARGALKLQRILELPPPRYRRMDDGTFLPID